MQADEGATGGGRPQPRWVHIEEPVSADLGLLAGRLRSKHDHRDRVAVSLADGMAAATALSSNRPLATSDPPLARSSASAGRLTCSRRYCANSAGGQTSVA